MGNETTKLTINIDINQASAKAKRLVADLQALERAGGKAGQGINTGMMQASQGIQQAGDAASTAAIKFQTATQGMLNLSTTGIQTFTSISNLARAENRAAAALVGKQRAQDALNRFQIKYNKLLESGTASTRDLTQAQNELNTAVEDYAVKAEKAKIEADAVLDIQLLFFANIMNVGVSSMQVLGSMLSATTKAMIGNTISTKLNTIAKFNNSHAIGGNVIAGRIHALNQGRQAVAMHSVTAATKLQTVALQGLKVALGPIGLIFIGISAAMAAYETNTLGLKDTINDLLGIQDDMNDSMGEGKQEADEFAQQLLELNDVAGKKLPDSFRKLKDEVIKLRGEMQLTGGEATNSFQKAIEAQKAIKGFSAAGKTSQQMREKELAIQIQKQKPNINNFLSGNRVVPQALGFLTIEANKRGIQILPDKKDFGPIGVGLQPNFPLSKPTGQTLKDLQRSPILAISTFFNSPAVIENDLVNTVLLQFGLTKENMKFLSTKKQKEAKELALELGVFEDTLKSDELQKKFAQLVNIQLEADGKEAKQFIDFPNITNILDPTDKLIPAALVTNKELFNLSFLPRTDRHPTSFVAGLIRSGQQDLIKQIDQKKLDFVLNGKTHNNLLAALIRRGNEFSAGQRIDPLSIAGIDEGDEVTANQLLRLIAFRGLSAQSNDRKSAVSQLFLRRLGVSPSLTPNGTSNIIIPTKLMNTLKKIEDSGSVKRAEVFIATGIDIGRVADSISGTDAMRIGNLEAALRDGSFFRSPESLFEQELLNQSGFQYKGIALVGVKTGHDRNGIPFVVKGRMMEVDLDGRKFSLPIGVETYQLMNQRAKQINTNLVSELKSNQQLVELSSFMQNKFFGKNSQNKDGIGGFGSGFFNQFNTSTPNAIAGSGFEGVSATAAFQLTGRPKIHPDFKRRRLERDRLVNSGLLHLDAAKRFAFGGSSVTFRGLAGIASRHAADSIHFKKANEIIKMSKVFKNTILAGFGNFGRLKPEEINSLFEAGLDDIANKALDIRDTFATSGLTFRGQQDALRQTIKPILELIGIDVDFTQKLKSEVRTVDWRGTKRRIYFVEGKSPNDLLREDLGIVDFQEETGTRHISIPAVNRKLMRNALIFYQNKFTDFDDMNITSQAYNSLVGQDSQSGITGQKIWDIRFNTTRGDRELENRMRFERMEAMATGVNDL